MPLSRTLLASFVLLAAMGGCARDHYRLNADRETYGIVDQKTRSPLWAIPPRSIDPPPASRNFTPYDPDCPPMPPDDPAAHEYMHVVNGRHGAHHWHRRGDAPTIEHPQWLEFLELTDDGVLELKRDRAVELGLLHSREYQFEMERLFLQALALTLERFEFDVQWSGGNQTFHEYFGESISERTPVDDSSLLVTDSNLGFSKSFSAGGQLLVDLANTFVWEFSGANSNTTVSSLSVGFVQPLLRGAFRKPRLESLTQAERQVLYAARDFARFRKQYYFDTVSGNGGYLFLLLQLQGIRNLKANLVSLERNLRAHEALAQAGIVPPLTVDQVFQSYQSGRLALIQAENAFETSLDAYKIQLGLPPEMEVHLDDSLLAPFELNSSQIEDLEGRLEELLVAFRELDEPPTRDRLKSGFERLRTLDERLAEELDNVLEELERWKSRGDGEDAADEDSGEATDADRERKLQQTLTKRLNDLRVDLAQSGREIAAALAGIDKQPVVEASELIQQLARRESSLLSDVFVIQTQIRAYLIELQPSGGEQQDAIVQGLSARLDLMNRRAEVVDAWRKIDVAADGLESDLDLFFDGDLNTDVDSNNAVKFAGDSSRYRVGVRFDGPLNRKAERNIYRAQLVNYQRARRRFIAERDGVVREIRRDIRNLETDRLNFQIARQRLIVAARQVELARVRLLAPGEEGERDSSNTQDALDALNSLLGAKNSLISAWVDYETDRLQLLLDTEVLQVDAQGLLIDDNSDEQRPEPLLDEPLPDPLPAAAESD